MRQLQPVIWSKGTFLSPQHLQSQERFVEESARFYLDSLNSKCWGFSDFQLDAKAVSEGMLTVTRASGIFPDALAFDIPMSDPAPPARAVDKCFQNGQKSCMFYLAIPQYVRGGMNIGVAHSEVSTRYVAQMQMVRDENSGTSEKPVQLARKNLRILAEGENLDGSVVLGITRIVKSEAGSYQVDNTYMPPLIDIHADTNLKRVLSSMIEQLVWRGNQLSGSRPSKVRSLADFGASDITNFWLLYTINTHLPGLRHLLNSSNVLPIYLFTELSDLAGALTTFSTKIEPGDLPVYNHEQLGACFGDLDRLIRVMLGTDVPRNVVSLPLKWSRDTIYATSIDKDAYFEGSKFYLAISADIRDSDLIDRVLRLLKASSAADIEVLIRNALRGLGLQQVATPPRAIRVKTRQVYFLIERDGKYWESVQRARSFAVHVPADILNPHMELVILLPQPA